MADRLARHAEDVQKTASNAADRGATQADSGRVDGQRGPAVPVSPFPTKGRAAAVSFRSSPELFDALTRVAAERKPLRQHPYTQQDILCVALMEWLERNGGWPPAP